jgi:hypothetical protein
MRRIVHKSGLLGEAHGHDVRRQSAMTPRERLDAARALQRRALGLGKDIRAFHQRRKT